MVTVSMSLPSSAVPAVGFLGGGMMASALIGGFLKGKAVAISQISVAEPYEPLRQKHAKSGLHTSASNVDVARRSQMLWLAVKPDVIPKVLMEISPEVRDTVVVSIAAGVSVSSLEAMLPAGVRVVRVMPNLPCLVGECAAGYTRGKHATPADAKLVKGMLSCVGSAEEVPEKLMDAVTGLSGSGPVRREHVLISFACIEITHTHTRTSHASHTSQSLKPSHLSPPRRPFGA